MPSYPVYAFNSETDYTAVLNTTKLMYSDLTSQSKGCCHSNKTEEVLCETDKLLQAAQIDENSGDVSRYQNDVKVAYKLLFTLVNN